MWNPPIPWVHVEWVNIIGCVVVIISTRYLLISLKTCLHCAWNQLLVRLINITNTAFCWSCLSIADMVEVCSRELNFKHAFPLKAIYTQQFSLLKTTANSQALKSGRVMKRHSLYLMWLSKPQTSINFNHGICTTLLWWLARKCTCFSYMLHRYHHHYILLYIQV